MARAIGVTVENDFSRGLITEATGLNFPEQAAIECENVIFTPEKRVIRRLGIDYEDSYTQVTGTEASLRDDAIVEFLWRAAANDGTVTFMVSQIGSTIHFYSANDGSLSAAKDSFTINLATYELTSGSARVAECQFASGDGKLFIVSEGIEPLMVEYSVGGDSITVTQLAIKIRDFTGAGSTEANDARVTTTPDVQLQYDLYNAGWNTTVNDGSTNDSAYDHWATGRADWPSKSDVWWKLKKTSTKTATPDNTFTYSYADMELFGNTKAPIGHYIIDAFVQDRDAASGLSGIADVDAGTRPTAVAFHSGRAWFAGVNAAGFGSRIYFSQIGERKEQFQYCYQAQDPTAEDFSDLLPSDGGTVLIPDMGVCYKLFPYENILFVFADNGIWAIQGSEGGGFKATDYTVSKVSSTGAIDFKSFVSVNGAPYWWNYEGIWTLGLDENTRKLTAISITDSTIQSYFDAIPLGSRVWVKGAYNDSEKLIQWVFRQTAPDGTATEERYQYDAALFFNVKTGVFYPYTWLTTNTTNGPFVSGIIAIKGLGATREEELVTDSSVTVTDSSVNVYTGISLTAVSLAQVFKYFVTVYDTSVWDMTFAQEIDETYTDWVTSDSTGKDFDSYFLTGFKVHGQGARKFQNNYIRVYTDVEANASLFIQALWHYGSSGDQGTITGWQAYTQDPSSREIGSTRLKLRGSGVAYQLKFYSEATKPFSLIGWSSYESMNSRP